MARRLLLIVVGLCAGCETDPVEHICPDVPGGGLVITELRGDQDPDDELGQWVELYNATGGELDLIGLHVRLRSLDGSKDDLIIVRRSLVVAADDYVVIGLGLDELRPAAIDYAAGTDAGTAMNETGAVDVDACDDPGTDQFADFLLIRGPAAHRHVLARADAAHRRRQRPARELVHQRHARRHPGSREPTMSMIRRASLLVLAATVALAACGPPRPRATSASRRRSRCCKLETPGLVIGEFTLAGKGRRRRHDPRRRSRQLAAPARRSTPRRRSRTRRPPRGRGRLAEVPRRPSAAAAKRPVKMATPIGEDAKQFAKHVLRRRAARSASSAIIPARSATATTATSPTCSSRRAARGSTTTSRPCAPACRPYFTEVRLLAPVPRRVRRRRGRGAQGASAASGTPARRPTPTTPSARRGGTRAASSSRRSQRRRPRPRRLHRLTHWDAIGAARGEPSARRSHVLGTVGEVRARRPRPDPRDAERAGSSRDFPLVFFDQDVFAAVRDRPLEGRVRRASPASRRSTRTSTTKQKQVQIVIDRAEPDPAVARSRPDHARSPAPARRRAAEPLRTEPTRSDAPHRRSCVARDSSSSSPRSPALRPRRRRHPGRVHRQPDRRRPRDHRGVRRLRGARRRQRHRRRQGVVRDLQQRRSPGRRSRA